MTATTTSSAALKSQIREVFTGTLALAGLVFAPFQLTAALWVGGRDLLAFYAWKARIRAGRKAAEARRRAAAAHRYGR